MVKQEAKNNHAGGDSVLDEIGGFLSNLWHHITDIVSHIFGHDKTEKSASQASAASADDDGGQSQDAPQNTGHNRRGPGRRNAFSTAASNNNGLSNGYLGADSGMTGMSGMSGAYPMSGDDSFPQVARMSAGFNGNSGMRHRQHESFAHGGGMQMCHASHGGSMRHGR